MEPLLTIAFDNNAFDEVAKLPLSTKITWDELRPFIEQIIKLREGEIVSGLLVYNSHIAVKISKKRIRKKKQQ